MDKPHLQSALAYTRDGQVGVMLILPPNALVETSEGELRPGVIMLPACAREIAYAFLLQAEQASNGILPPT